MTITFGAETAQLLICADCGAYVPDAPWAQDIHDGWHERLAAHLGDQLVHNEPPSIDELRRRMADAHPDRGGTNEEFIAARKRYEQAKAK